MTRYIDTSYTFISTTIPKAENITIDGDSSDWRNVAPIITDYDKSFDHPSLQAFNLTKLYIALDNESLYFAAKFAEPMNNKYSNFSLFRQDVYVSFDIDSDGSFDLYFIARRYSHRTFISVKKTNN